jgi:hypothetical protein
VEGEKTIRTTPENEYKETHDGKRKERLGANLSHDDGLNLIELCLLSFPLR